MTSLPSSPLMLRTGDRQIDPWTAPDRLFSVSPDSTLPYLPNKPSSMLACCPLGPPSHDGARHGLRPQASLRLQWGYAKFCPPSSPGHCQKKYFGLQST